MTLDKFLYEIVEIQNLGFNPYAIPHLVSGQLLLLLGIFVYLQNRKSLANFSYLLVCASCYPWLVGDYWVMSFKNHAQSLFMVKFVYVGVTLIPPTVYFFSAAWLNLLKEKKKWVTIFYIAAFIIIGLYYGTDKFVIGTNKYSWGFLSNVSAWQFLLVAYFFGVVGCFFWNLYRGYRRETIPIKKMQIKGVIIAFLIGFGIGSTEWLPTFGIGLYPLGSLASFLLLSIIAYIIIRYRLMEIETVIHKTMMWLVASSFVLLPIVFLSYWLRSWYQKATPLAVAILCGAVFFVLTLYLRFIQPHIDHLFQRRRYDMERTLDQFITEVTHLKGLGKLIERIEQIVTETLYPEDVYIYLYNQKLKEYILVNRANRPSHLHAIAEKHQFVQWLARNERIAYAEFIDIDPAFETVKKEAKEYFHTLEIVLVVPLVLDNQLIGIVNLGRKTNLRRYNAADLQFLTRLKNQSTIAISNSRLYDTMEEQVRQRTEELVNTQKQLVQAEKLATVGTLAGGVAHEINNPLTAILTNIQMLQSSDAIKDTADKESLELVEQATQRCRSIVQKLMVYSRKPQEDQREVLSRVEMPAVIQNVVNFLGYQLQQENIRIVTHLKKVPPVEGNQNELEQVLTNLILNARDAIRAIKKSGQIEIFLTEQDRYVITEIADEGHGIPKEYLLKIFDPFFTTKDVGQGAGLGLSICQAIAQKHKGEIGVSSEVGEGTVFKFKIPAAG